ncbi:patatin-like phospholipase family protein [Xylanivirga thermophila]|uniref:patatin-like phospholipase family protein n=1 Tax=Xylanivirga thermophila TaxID=2496273 RepID=UPI00101C9EC5|nr:patatin-like phospholipase family protein [Xylanivirga thermophila]
MEEFGLVFAGGGAKGSYEIGVWKALMELKIPIIAVAGTSVGALNGAMVVQGDFEAAKSIWTDISVQDVMDVQKDILDKESSTSSFMDRINMIKETIIGGGLDVTPLSNLLHSVIDEEKIRKSPIDLGLVTFSLTDFKPVRLFKDDIPEGQLIDYLMASACFPAFKPKEIDNKRFIDGGVYDNIPISLITEKGIKNIIVVDISGVGMPKKVDTDGLNIINIKTSQDLGKTLDFDKERSKVNMEIGYLDALKAFGRINGKKYYIMPDDNNLKNRDDIGPDLLLSMYRIIGITPSSTPTPLSRSITVKLFKNIDRYMDEQLNKKDAMYMALSEITAEQLGIEKKATYTLEGLNEEIIDQINSILERDEFKEYSKNIPALLSKTGTAERDIKRVLSVIKADKRCLAIYLATCELTDEKMDSLRKLIAMTMPKLSISAIYICTILESIK